MRKPMERRARFALNPDWWWAFGIACGIIGGIIGAVAVKFDEGLWPFGGVG